MQDVLAALIVHLKTVVAVTDLVSTRIFGGELPEDEISSMPRKCVVLRYIGGLVEFRTHREQKPRLDIFCYGEDYYEAGRVDGAVADALFAIRRTDVNNTLLYSIGYSSGPRQMKEPDTGWRYVTRSAIVRAGETTTA